MQEEKPMRVYEVLTPDGEVISHENVLFSYTREGRRIVGKEFPNPVPMEPPLGFKEAPPLHEQIRAMVAQELSKRAGEADHETFEEADDFDTGEDYDPGSPFELEFEPTVPWPADPRVVAAEQAAVSAVAAETPPQKPGVTGDKSPVAKPSDPPA